jgi:membrane-associated phospholipid phosphatase
MSGETFDPQPELEPVTRPTIFEQKVILSSLALGILSILLFAWIADSVEDNRAQYFDFSVRSYVHRYQSPQLDDIMVAISFVGGNGLIIAAVSGLVLFLRYRRRRAALWLLVTLGGALILDLALKYGFHRPRPVPFIGHAPVTPSFPSGHALFSFCFYGVLAGLLAARTRSLILRITIWTFTAVLVLAIGLSRIYLGVHYPSDVVAGYVTGTIWVATLVFLDRWRTQRWRTQRRNRESQHTAAIVLAAFSLLSGGDHSWAQSVASSNSDGVGSVRVDADPKHVLNSFDPDQALGSSLDVLSRADIDKVLSPHIVQESLSAGWGPISYRNNTELRMGAWHWNENGTWSDPAHQSGYFTGSTDLKQPIRYILAYALPHRGFATSGDAPVPGPNLSYWKSNPYLTSHFTGERDALHPQWVVIDLHASRPVNAIRVAWASPYAVSYQVESWEGKDALDFDHGPEGQWKVFSSGVIRNGAGGTVTVRLSEPPVSTQFLRVLMTESSNTCDEHGSDDIRNCVGYAIQSIDIGTVDASGLFTNAIEPGAEQPVYCASSIDPWHSAADVRDDGKYQHTGFDLFFRSGITNNLPAMIPVTMLYGTPDDAAAQIAYIEKRAYPISYIEMGEEPDGKHTMPEDYAALYLQWATALHKVDPKLKLGGPVFEGVNDDIHVWPDAEGRTSWMGRFIAYLKAHGRLSDLSFVSFEHYPFEPCNITWESLYSEPRLVKHILQVWRDDGVPPDVPLMITEDHLAAGLTGPMSTIFSALWLADNVGAFFEGGGAVFHHSPIQPEPVRESCMGGATWSNFLADSDYNISGYTALYFAARLINLDWVSHHSGVHRMFPSFTGIKDESGNVLVTSYAVHRPDGNWSLLLVNRDEHSAHTVTVQFADPRNRPHTFVGPVAIVTFGSEQYVWKDEGLSSHPDPDGPPSAATLTATPQRTFVLPKASITVLRGRVPGI